MAPDFPQRNFGEPVGFHFSIDRAMRAFSSWRPVALETKSIFTAHSRDITTLVFLLD